jgi:hypothetical protein
MTLSMETLRERNMKTDEERMSCDSETVSGD